MPPDPKEKDCNKIFFYILAALVFAGPWSQLTHPLEKPVTKRMLRSIHPSIHATASVVHKVLYWFFYIFFLARRVEVGPGMIYGLGLAFSIAVDHMYRAESGIRPACTFSS